MKKVSTFKERFIKALEITEMTAADVSRKTGIHEGTLSRYKKGLQEPKIDNLEAIARTLHVNNLWLSGYNEEMHAPLTMTKTESFTTDEEFLKYEMYCDSILELPPEQQQMVYDYIDFLFVKYKKEQEEYIRSIIPEE